MDHEQIFEILDKYDPDCAEWYRNHAYLVGCDVRNYAKKLIENHGKQRVELPDEFDFISHVNEITRGRVYHARRADTARDFVVTLEGCTEQWAYDDKELLNEINGLNFEIVGASDDEDE